MEPSEHFNLQKTRTAAFDAGESTYNTGKPCRFGHYADRYTSSGACIQCLKANLAKSALRNESLRQKQNAKRFQFVDSYARTVPIDKHPYMDILRDIFLYGHDWQKAEVCAYLDASKVDRFSSPIQRPALIDDAMSRSDILAFVKLDPTTGHVVNGKDFDYAGSDDQDPEAGPPRTDDCIRMNGKWYKVHEVLQVLFNKQTSVKPVKIGDDLMQLPQKGIIK